MTPLTSHSSWPVLPLVFAVFGAGCAEPEPPPAAAVPTPPAAEPEPEPSPVPVTEPEEEAWEGEQQALAGVQQPEASSESPSEGHPAAANASSSSLPAESRSPEVIASVVKQNRQRVRDCYEKARETTPNLKGDLVIHFVLTPNGRVKKAELNQAESTLKDPQLAACAVEVIKSILFPRSSRGMESEVNYPFNLNP